MDKVLNIEEALRHDMVKEIHLYSSDDYETGGTLFLAKLKLKAKKNAVCKWTPRTIGPLRDLTLNGLYQKIIDRVNKEIEANS